MKSLIPSLILVASLIAVLAKDHTTFAVLRFTNKHLTQGRMDPIVSPGKISTHVHTVMGGSNPGMNSTSDSLILSRCTNAKIQGDHSSYWFPSLYFHDETAKTFELVDIYYVNVYYL
jgi:hypothetical protein